MNDTGLSHKFTLSAGKLAFGSGQEKAQDDLGFYLGFIGWFRTYTEDYPPDVLNLVQKPTTAINQYKTLTLGKLQQSLRLYVPLIKVNSLDFTPIPGDRLSWALGITFSYPLDPTEELTAVTFIS